MKICSKCKQTKTFDNFYKDINRKSGLVYCCKSCWSNKYFKNKPKVIIIQKELKHYTPDYKRVIKNLQLSQPINDYSNSLTVGDWDNLTKKQKKYYENTSN